jgi:rfaE bifunctional protein nucleotidyltransferase chain/domain
VVSLKKIAVNGTFDILHPGHVRLLTYAKGLGDHLLVAIDSDSRVAELKGPSRPIHPFAVRKEMLLALKPVDEVVVFSSADELERIIKDSNIDYIVKGSDHRNHHVEGNKYVKEVIWYDRYEEFSSTKTIERISNR